MRNAISPLDGRYADRLTEFRICFSEEALTEYRVWIEVQWILALSEDKIIPEISEETRDKLQNLIPLTAKDTDKIYEIEKTVKHDVKACELYIASCVPEVAPYVHIGLTSEDVTNLAYALILNDYKAFQIENIKDLINLIANTAHEHSGSRFPAHTHGQLATPTTYGKELSVFASRLHDVWSKIKKHEFSAKLNGSTGTYAALTTAYPDVDWINFSHEFISDFGLKSELATTQISNHDSIVHYLNLVEHLNNILLDFNVDMWEYISRGYLIQEVVPEEVGSSVMPHKVNPINFENSEGNIAISNALLYVIAEKLSHSRMQRDLSNSTVKRNLGVALAHHHLAVCESWVGFRKLRLNHSYCNLITSTSYTLKSEAMQTVLRKHGRLSAYNMIKDAVRGNDEMVAADHLRKLILTFDGDLRKELQDIYDASASVGKAEEICENAIRGIL